MLDTEEMVAARSAQPKRDGPELHLTITSIGGSVEHYHHFLLGFFVPLVNQRGRSWENSKFARVLIRSCGPMDGLVRELKAPRIAILDKNEHQRLGEKRPRIANVLRGRPFGAGPRRYMALMGHDLPSRYNRLAFARARATLSTMLEHEIAAFHCPWPEDIRLPRILLIERGKPSPFYLSERSELKQAGAMRRSIPNHHALQEALSREFGNIVNVMLEGLPLAHQIALFGAADVIIAQHGAALSNAIWARPRASIVEIAPDTLDRHTRALGFFSNLARSLGLGYYAVGQPGDHADVDRGALFSALRAAIKGQSGTPPGRS